MLQGSLLCYHKKVTAMFYLQRVTAMPLKEGTLQCHHTNEQITIKCSTLHYPKRATVIPMQRDHYRIIHHIRATVILM